MKNNKLTLKVENNKVLSVNDETFCSFDNVDMNNAVDFCTKVFYALSEHYNYDPEYMLEQIQPRINELTKGSLHSA